MQALAPVRGLVVAALLALAAAAAAQEKSTQPPAMSPEEQAAMQKMIEYATPGEPHKLLAARAGTYDTKVTMWMAPGAPPVVTEGTSKYEVVMDGRYVQDTHTATFQGMPFSGQGLCGYDNMKKKYFSTWIDNMGTGLMMSEGTYDAATKTYTFEGENPDPMTGKMEKMKSVEKVTSPDAWTVEMFKPTPDGKGWWKTMELTYTRQKK
jgi:hypothetical protein